MQVVCVSANDSATNTTVMDQLDRLIWQAGVAFSKRPLKAASVSWILGVCSQLNLETVRENTGNIATWAQPCLSPVTENFYPFYTGRTQNGKLSELVSEKDIRSGRNFAKIVRLVNARSLQCFVGVTQVTSFVFQLSTGRCSSLFRSFVGGLNLFIHFALLAR